MSEEWLFFGMVLAVLLPMVAGALAGRLPTGASMLWACTGWALLQAVLVFILSGPVAAEGYAVLLAVATGLFSWVIGVCAALFSRRLRQASS